MRKLVFEQHFISNGHGYKTSTRMKKKQMREEEEMKLGRECGLYYGLIHKVTKKNCITFHNWE